MSDIYTFYSGGRKWSFLRVEGSEVGKVEERRGKLDCHSYRTKKVFSIRRRRTGDWLL